MSSASEDQLLAFADYYLNGLYHPLIRSSEYPMMQEAFRYELPDADSEISITGIVCNEMKGMSSITWAAQANFNRLMAPESIWSSDTSGDPDRIPDLTLEEIRFFHEKYYHPSNSLMVLSGDIDLERFLAKLDSDFLSGFDKREPVRLRDSEVLPPEPVYEEKIFEFPAEAGTDDEDASVIQYGFAVPSSGMKDFEMGKAIAALLSMEGSPFMEAAAEELPNATISVSFLPQFERPVLLFSAEDANASDSERFKQIVDGALADLLENGIDAESLSAVVKNRLYDLLLSKDDPDYYLNLDCTIGGYWALMDGDPDAGILADDLEAQYEETITADILTGTLRRFFRDSVRSVMAVTIPVPGKTEEKAAELRAHLNAMKAAMSPEEIDALVRKTAEFNLWQKEGSAVPFPEELSALEISDLPEEVRRTETVTDLSSGIRVIRSALDTTLVHVDLELDAGTGPFDSIFDFEFLTILLGELGTASDPQSKPANEIPAVSRDMTFSCSLTEYSDGTYTPKLSAAWYTLVEDLDASFSLAEDILLGTVFSDRDRIRATAARTMTGLAL